MKIFRVLLPVLLTTVTAVAQSPAQADSSPLLILNLKAGYEQPKHSSSFGAELSPIPRTDWASLRERQMFYRTNIPLALPARPDGTRSPQQAVIAEQNPAYNPNTSTSPGETITTMARIAYSAFLIVKNTSGKTIKAVEWEYLLVDPGNQQQLQRNKLLTKKEIKPGATAVLTERVKLPRGRSSEPHNLVDQRALIKRIEYTDGSVWQRP